MTCSLKSLRSSFIEINRAQAHQRPLVPFNGRVYDSGSLWGRILRFFLGKDTSKKLDVTLAKIQDSFKTHARRFDQARIHYYRSLSKELTGNPFSLKEREKAQNIMLKFCLHLKPLLKDACKGIDMPYLKAIQMHDKQHLADLKTVCEVANHFGKMVNLQKSTDTVIPLVPLLKMGRDIRLKAKERDVIQKWIKKMQLAENKKIASFKGASVLNSSCRVRSLHRTIRGLVTLFNGAAPDPNVKAEVGRIELALLEKGASVFGKADELHLKWADQFAPGSQVVVNGVSYTIEGIIPQDEEEKQPRKYALQGHPDMELVVEENEALGFIRDYLNRLKQYGIRTPKILALEEKARGYVQERLYNPLHQIEWHIGAEDIDPQDLPLANPIVELLRGLKALPFTPLPLSAKSFGFTHKGEIRARHLLQRTRKSFEALQFLAYECSLDKQGRFHPAMYQHLMRESRLFDMPQARAWLNVVQLALEGMPPPENGSKSDLWLHASITALKEKMLEDARAQENPPEENQIKQAILLTFVALPLVPELRDFFYQTCQEALHNKENLDAPVLNENQCPD